MHTRTRTPTEVEREKATIKRDREREREQSVSESAERERGRQRERERERARETQTSHITKADRKGRIQGADVSTSTFKRDTHQVRGVDLGMLRVALQESLDHFSGLLVVAGAG